MPAQFGELSFGTRKADNKPIKLKYWEPSPYSYEELKIFHRVLVDGEPFDPKIIDYSWRWRSVRSKRSERTRQEECPCEGDARLLPALHELRRSV